MERFAIAVLILLSSSASRPIQSQELGPAPPGPSGDAGSQTYSSSEFTGVVSPAQFPRVLNPELDEPAIVLPRWFTRGCTISAGYERGWLQPRFANNVSVVIQQPTGVEARAFDHSFETSSRVWAGIENARCNGIRASYWEFDSLAPTQVTFATAAASPLTLTIFGAGGNLQRTATANLGDAMTSDHAVELRTVDLEATHRFRYCGTEVLTALGLRYGSAFQRAHAVATDSTGPLTELVCQDLNFEGLGPTVEAQLTRSLFTNHSVLCGFSCYANTRASLLFGTQRQEIVLVTAGGATLAEDLHEQDDFLPIAGIGGGLQWARRPLGHCLWIVRAGYRAECWFGAGGPVGTDGNLALGGMLLSIAASW